MFPKVFFDQVVITFWKRLEEICLLSKLHCFNSQYLALSCNMYFQFYMLLYFMLWRENHKIISGRSRYEIFIMQLFVTSVLAWALELRLSLQSATQLIDT